MRYIIFLLLIFMVGCEMYELPKEKPFRKGVLTTGRTINHMDGSFSTIDGW